MNHTGLNSNNQQVFAHFPKKTQAAQNLLTGLGGGAIRAPWVRTALWLIPIEKDSKDKFTGKPSPTHEWIEKGFCFTPLRVIDAKLP
jgi:hypothetical protein